MIKFITKTYIYRKNELSFFCLNGQKILYNGTSFSLSDDKCPADVYVPWPGQLCLLVLLTPHGRMLGIMGVNSNHKR